MTQPFTCEAVLMMTRDALEYDGIDSRIQFSSYFADLIVLARVPTWFIAERLGRTIDEVIAWTAFKDVPQQHLWEGIRVRLIRLIDDELQKIVRVS